MALEYDKNGMISLKNRLNHFDRGTPTDSSIWKMFKSIPEDAKYHDVEVTMQSIQDCFSSIKDSCTLMTLITPMDQFKVWCKDNDLIYQEKDHGQSVVIRNKFISGR